MSAEDRDVVADHVESALRGLDIEELNGRAGYWPGSGYVDPGEAADEILDEALQLFLDDLARGGELGMRPAAVELAVGILRGLYRCRTVDRNPCWSTPRTTPPNARRTWWISAGSSESSYPSLICLISYQPGARSCIMRAWRDHSP
jgi:hypothetical protein